MNQKYDGFDKRLLATWGELHGNRSHLARTKDVFIGLESEYEGSELIPPGSTDDWVYWTIHSEGSLRDGGVEYVLRKPFEVKEVLSAGLTELMKHTNKANFRNSIRTSTHLHINILNQPIIKIYTFLTAYYLVENILVHLNGKDREGNLHCLRLTDSTDIVSKLSDEVKNTTYFATWTTNNRYAAMNLSSLKKFGSVELRFMKAYITRADLTLWITNLTNLFRNAIRRFDTPQDVMNYYYAVKPKEFLRLFFDESFMDLIKQQMDLATVTQFMAANTMYIYEIISGFTHNRTKKIYTRPAILRKNEDLPLNPTSQHYIDQEDISIPVSIDFDYDAISSGNDEGN